VGSESARAVPDYCAAHRGPGGSLLGGLLLGPCCRGSNGRRRSGRFRLGLGGFGQADGGDAVRHVRAAIVVHLHEQGRRLIFLVSDLQAVVLRLPRALVDAPVRTVDVEA